MWMEEEPDQRVNQLRMKDAVATQADIVVTACPFCLQMFEDASGALEMEKPLEVIDLVELLERAVKLPVMPVESVTPLESGTTTKDRPLTVIGSG